ncbi:YveK family protein [Marinilactibacillus sp. Marseille-P9653]|uniref:YveK family protein n=1 Tax=Marinilactibacillus sp. Marseille-P9653 TaxID=2866583 RepID=UPI001CE4788B|nr:Wzz/FepE/Etk N-terminal domain-containing protein [Marinilactibacillus sp. Marseille-P9653]
MEEEINLVEVVKILKKRMGIIINMVLLGVVFSSIYTFFILTPSYSANTQLLVNRTQDTEMIQRADIDTNVQLINTYSDIIRNPVILDAVIEELNLNSTTDNLRNQISITTENNSQVFAVQVTDNSPYNAAAIANTTASVFQEKLNTIMNIDNVTVISDAVANTNPVSPNKIVNIVIGVLLGGLLGLGVVFISEFLDTSVKDGKFITDDLGWSNLGHISIMTSEELKLDKRLNGLQEKNVTRTTRSRV